jgi:hypothetical protein
MYKESFLWAHLIGAANAVKNDFSSKMMQQSHLSMPFFRLCKRLTILICWWCRFLCVDPTIPHIKKKKKKHSKKSFQKFAFTVFQNRINFNALYLIFEISGFAALIIIAL